MRSKTSTGTLGGIAAIITALVGSGGLVVHFKDKPDKESTRPPVEFTVYDRLHRNEVCKYLSISIDGRPAGSLALDETHPSATLKLSVPKAGAHSYSLDGLVTVRHLFGRQQQLRGSGRAAIDVTPGQTFEPRVKVQDNAAHLSLHPATGAAE